MKYSIFTTKLNPINMHLNKNQITYKTISTYKSELKMLLAKRIDFYAFEERAFKFLKQRIPSNVGCLKSPFQDDLIFVMKESERNKKIVDKLNKYFRNHLYDRVSEKFLKSIQGKN